VRYWPHSRWQIWVFYCVFGFTTYSFYLRNTKITVWWMILWFMPHHG